MRGVFVTGTGTGVGKTFVSCALARRARALGMQRVFAFKPIETGCARRGDELIGADQELLCEAAGNWQRGALRGLYRFAPPVAPQVAAEQAGVEIDLEKIRSVATPPSGIDFTVVEGAGGWRVPITAAADMSTLARMVGLPVVIVAQATLGTINHSLLTIDAVEHDGQTIYAVVLSRRPKDDLAQATDNAARIGARWNGRIRVVSDVTDVDPLLNEMFHVEH